IVRSRRPLLAIARTSAIGLRRGPQPPMPTVIPSRSSAITASAVVTLSMLLLGEGRAGLVADAREGELVGEALLVAIAAADVDRIDAVERLLGGADRDRRLRRDLRRDLAGRRAQAIARHDLEHAAEAQELGRRDLAAGV